MRNLSDLCCPWFLEWNICNFLTDRSVLLFMVGPWECVWTFANKEIHEEFLNSFRVKAGPDGKTNGAVKGLGFWSSWYQPDFQGEHRGWRLSSVTCPVILSTSQFKEIPVKILDTKVHLHFWSIAPSVFRDGDLPRFSGERT